MAKSAKRSTLQPQVFGLGNGIYRSDVLSVVEGQTYAVAENVQRVVVIGPIDHDSTSVELLRGFIYVPPWAKEITVRTVSDGCAVDVGSGSATLGAGTKTATIATSSSGTGMVIWTVTNAATSGTFEELVIEAGPTAAADIPDPVFE